MQSSTMPDDRDVSYDPEEEFPWDCDLQASGESEVADLLDDGEDE